MKNVKQLLVAAFVTVMLMQSAFADDTANIRLNISDPASVNKYFLCLPGNGCFSILAGNKGKIYPSLRPIQVENILLTNVEDLRLYSQGLPPSCNVQVNTGQTLTIHGSIVEGDGGPHINGLHCTVS